MHCRKYTSKMRNTPGETKYAHFLDINRKNIPAKIEIHQEKPIINLSQKDDTENSPEKNARIYTAKNTPEKYTSWKSNMRISRIYTAKKSPKERNTPGETTYAHFLDIYINRIGLHLSFSSSSSVTLRRHYPRVNKLSKG